MGDEEMFETIENLEEIFTKAGRWGDAGEMARRKD